MDELVTANKLLHAQNAALVLENKELGIIASIFHSQEGMLITDAHLSIVRVNQAFTEITGYLLEEALNKKPNILSSGRHDKAFYKHMWQCLNNQGKWEGKIWNRRKNGDVYAQHLLCLERTLLLSLNSYCFLSPLHFCLRGGLGFSPSQALGP